MPFDCTYMCIHIWYIYIYTYIHMCIYVYLYMYITVCLLIYILFFGGRGPGRRREATVCPAQVAATWLPHMAGARPGGFGGHPHMGDYQNYGPLLGP